MRGFISVACPCSVICPPIIVLASTYSVHARIHPGLSVLSCENPDLRGKDVKKKARLCKLPHSPRLPSGERAY